MTRIDPENVCSRHEGEPCSAYLYESVTMATVQDMNHNPARRGVCPGNAHTPADRGVLCQRCHTNDTKQADM